ncbi:hypothetical protein LOD99_4067 [Oopsacas minuta]|uniref:Transposase n=1 Tax=Oopsacas minuta TaxID=111878 RepID=A0AAV7JXD3_9METZ|nr:hypothetical protein LOD99_4067 [Oopsacas minuta]
MLVIPSDEDRGITNEQHGQVIEQLIMPGEKKKRCSYTEKDKIRIIICANQVGTTNAMQQYKKYFPHLAESTLRGWLSKFRAGLKKKSLTDLIQISSKRGRPLLLDEDLDKILRTFINNLRIAGGTVDRHSVHGVLMGIIKSNLGKYGGLWNEVRDRFLNEIVTAVALHNIPDELIINVDQTPSKFVSTGNFTMAGTNSKQVAKKGSNDKRGMTIALAETLSGKMLPFQLIYHGKTARSLPTVPFPEGFLLSYSEKHWSNERKRDPY